ncbi:MAG: hypothetical protein K9H12_08545 [Bacteroidales bacterium]|nr:hypothetical protein [Bacteroidales bacterium]
MASSSINAQWYSSQYGVTNMNELNKEQLTLALDQGNKMVKGGTAATIVGASVFIVGVVMYSQGLGDIGITTNSSGGIEFGLGKSMMGFTLMTIGGLATTIGIPLWIIGKQRVDVVNIHLVKFSNTGFIPTISFSIPIG